MTTEIVEELMEQYKDLLLSLRLDALLAGIPFEHEKLWPKAFCPMCGRKTTRMFYIKNRRMNFMVSAAYSPKLKTLIYYWMCDRCTRSFPKHPPKKQILLEDIALARMEQALK